MVGDGRAKHRDKHSRVGDLGGDIAVTARVNSTGAPPLGEE